MSKIVWRTLDRESDVIVSQRQLPHWDQTDALTFVTFRLADSMPKSVIELWIAEQENWLIQNNLTFESFEHVLQTDSTPTELKNSFRKARLKSWHEKLDRCHGSCGLRDHRMASIVSNTLRHFDGQRYDLERFIVMPNHVHLLVQIRAGFTLRKQREGWLRFSARKINKLLGLKGEFWQSEPFDHVLRSEKQFRYLQDYITDNPVKARLSEGEYLLWVQDQST